MKKIIYILAVLVVLIIGGFYLFKGLNHKTSVEAIHNGAINYKDATYTINGQKVTLKNGMFETEAAPGLASKITTKYFGNEVKKDLNGDGREDVAFLLTQDEGGSGVFFYVVGALNTENGYIGSDAVLLGDRIAPQTTESGPGNSIVVNYGVRASGEPMTTQPSIGKTLRLVLDPTTMQFAEVGQDFEGEVDPSHMSLSMKTWTWINATYNDGKKVEPQKKDAFTLTFKNDGTFGATTDCNSMSGSYTVENNTMTFTPGATTLMFCDGSQEKDFTSLLTQVNSYMFTSKGELVFSLKNDSGSAYFK